MKCFLLTLGAALLSVAYAQKYTTPVPILKQINKHNEDGSYSYGYEGADGTFKIETKYADGQVYGKYGYVDDSGKVREVEYGASRRGFEPQGNDINVAPPTLKAKNEYVVPLREGEQDDGQYREDPAVYYKDEAYNQPAYQQQPAYKQPSYQDTRYQQPAYEPQEPVYQPQQPVFRPQRPVYQPQQPAYQPQQPAYQPQQPAYQPTYRAPAPRPVAQSNFDDFENFRSSLGFSQPKPKATYTPSYTPPANNYNTGYNNNNNYNTGYNNNYNSGYSKNNNNRGYTSNSYQNSEPLPFNVDLNSGSYSLNY